MLSDLVKANRSYRRFEETKPLSREMLTRLVDLTRFVPSAQNKQPLKYILSSTPEKNQLIFPYLAWAGYLKDWPGPKDGERPVAYIIILGDKEISTNFYCDHGIAVQTMLLAAVELGVRGCIIANIQRERLRAALAIPQQYEILLALALGYPHETIVLEQVKDGDIRYWRDDESVHHVPKRDLSEIILNL